MPRPRLAASAPVRRLEVVVVDVVGVEHGGRTDDDDAALFDRALAEVAGLEGVADLAGDVAVSKRLAGERRHVAELRRVPQGELA